MKQRKFMISVLISLFCFTSCGTQEISESIEYTTPEITTENTSEGISEQTTEQTTPETPVVEPLISLFDKNSKFYTLSLKGDDVSTLKTYHHKNYGDVPFIDLEEFHYAIRPLMEKPRTFTIIDKENYLYTTVDEKGKIYFDAKNDTIKFINFNQWLDFYGENNGVRGDITGNNLKLYKGSEKTTYLKPSQDVTINLKDYGYDMVSENNRLYISIGALSSTLLPSLVNGISYNGKDFFSNSLLRKPEASVYARSGNYCFSWPLASSECPTAFKKVENKLEKEAYRFEGFFGDKEDRDDVITLSLFKDGTGTMKGSGGSVVNKAARWNLDGDILKLVAVQTPYETTDMDEGLSDPLDVWINTKETNYGKKTRSEEMSKENYRELCLSMDYSYGLKKEKNIESFDKFFQEKKLKDRLLSNDIIVYQDAFTELIYTHFDDIHSTINGGESIYSDSEIRSYFRNKIASYQGPRYKGYYDSITKYGLLRGESGYTDSYIVEGNTAYLRFQIFTHSPASFNPITHKDYQTTSHEEAVRVYQNAVGNNPYKAFAVAFNDFGKMDNIKNVVIDLVGNLGGEIRCAPYLAAFLTLDPSIVIENSMDHSLIDYHYKVDLNGDGVFGGNGDSFEGKYKFYLLNGANFSAGNEFPTMAKNTGFAKVIGDKSAGGACAIANRSDITGVTYRLSSMFRLMVKQGDSYIANDDGIEPDYKVPFDNMFDLKKLDAWLNTLA